MRNVKINENDANQRLDKFISKLMPTMPKSMLYKGLRKNNVRLNGKHIHKGEYILKSGDELTLYFSEEFTRKKTNQKKLPSPNIVYEDKNIIICDKPVNLPCHSDEKKSSDTMIGRILYYLEQKGEYTPENENCFSPALCNRLDRNTRGLLIAAKNAAALRFINEKIRNREIRKFYFAVCEGIFEKKEDTLISKISRVNKKSFISDNDGLETKTYYKVIDEKNGCSEVEIELFTGRTHQIRAQMAHIGHPLVGDNKYGAEKTNFSYNLISYKLIFDFSDECGEFLYLKGLEVKI